MLKEARVEIFLKSILELDCRRLPRDLVRELDVHAGHELDLVLARQVDVNNSVGVEAQVEFLVCPQPVGVFFVVVLANNAPDGQVVDVHLIPVVVLDRVREQLILVLAQIDRTVFGSRLICSIGNKHTAELQLHAQ